jgi:ABC-2 type transport system ATP-binding protein
MEEAEYCDDILLIYRARAIAAGTPDDLKRQAADMTGADDPTMEDAFIAMIEASDAEREAAGRQAA